MGRKLAYVTYDHPDMALFAVDVFNGEYFISNENICVHFTWSSGKNEISAFFCDAIISVVAVVVIIIFMYNIY